MPTEEFDSVHNVNARGIFFCTAEVAKVMQAQDEKFTESRSGRRGIGRGSIINLLSLNAKVPVSTHGQYGASKYAALGITHTAGKVEPLIVNREIELTLEAAELARKGVRVNCILPTWVDTPVGPRRSATQLG